MTQESTVTPFPSPLSASLLAQRLPFSGGGFSSSCASLASLNARLFLPAFVIHRAAFPRPSTAPAAEDSAAGRQGWRSQTGGGKMQKRTEESLLSSGRFKFFPAAGHARSQLFCPPIPPNQLSRRKQVLCFFLDARKKRSPRILQPSLPALKKQRPPPRLEEGAALLLSIHAYPQSTRGGLRRVPSHVRGAVQRPRAQIDRGAAIAHNAAVLRVHADV